MNKNYTSIEQSKNLLKLGLDLNTANMYYPHLIRMGSDTYDDTPEIGEFDYPYEFPCWSVDALINIMPCSVRSNSEGMYFLKILKGLLGYSVRYENECLKLLQSSYHSTLIDACYDMMVWLLKNDYIKNNKND